MSYKPTINEQYISNEFKIVDVKSSYIVVRDSFKKYIVYTKDEFYFDEKVYIKGYYLPIEDSKGFYKFSFNEYCLENNILGQINATSIKHSSYSYSVRYLMQKRINEYDNSSKEILNSILLNIRNQDLFESKLFSVSGFNVLGALYIIESIIKKVLNERHSKLFMITLNFLACFIYRFPLILTYQLIRRIKNRKVGLIICGIMYRGCLSNIGYIIILFNTLFQNISFVDRYFYLSLFQSIKFYSINLIEILVYRYLRKLMGIVYILCIFRLFINALFINDIILFLDNMLSYLSSLNIYGTCIGVGLLFYIFILVVSRKNKHFKYLRIVLLNIFLLFGLFHPLQEVTYLNVGQGDCMLLKSPLYLEVILIDTGKPSQWRNVETYLHAKGINHIDYLYISHDDDDHSGNKERILKEYSKCELIEGHFHNRKHRFFNLYDLNDINSDDLNQNSQVICTRINKLNYLFTGDSDYETEKKIIHKYPNLEVDILKVGHHGSDTSSSDKFLDAIKPDIAIISSGAYKIYHHPCEKVIQKLLKRHIDYYLTREEGDISVVSFFRMNFLITSSGKVRLIKVI